MSAHAHKKTINASNQIEGKPKYKIPLLIITLETGANNKDITHKG